MDGIRAAVIFEQDGKTWLGPVTTLLDARRAAAGCLRVWRSSAPWMVGRPIGIVRERRE